MEETPLIVIEQNTQKGKKRLLIGLVVFFILIIAMFILSVSLSYLYRDRVYPGVMMDEVSLSGLGKEQVYKVAMGKYKEIIAPGLEFSYKDTNKRLDNESTEGTIAKFDFEKTADKAINAGKTGSWLSRQLNVLVYPFLNKKIAPQFSLDSELLKSKLSQAFFLQENPAVNSNLEISIINENDRDYFLNFTPSSSGEIVFYEKAIADLN